MKRILVLGGGAYQVPLAKYALEAGYLVGVASLGETDPAMKLAHESYAVNITDCAAVRDIVTSRDFDAVVSTGTDFSVRTIGFLHDTLGLPGVSMESAAISTDKALTREAFALCGVPSAAFRRVKTLEEAAVAADEIGYPVMVKAPDSSGSRGIRSVDDPGGLTEAFTDAVRVSKIGEILVEERLEGIEFGAQAIVVDGEVIACICHNDTVTPPPVCVPIGHSLPFRLGEDIERETRDVCAAAAKAMKLGTAVCNADVIATADGVRMFEMGARIGATGIPEIVKISTGIDLYRIAIDMALGYPVDDTPHAGLASAYLVLRSNITGVLAATGIPGGIHNFGDIREIRFDYEHGAEVRAFVTGPDRIGHVLVAGSSADDAEMLALRTSDALKITVNTGGRSQTDRPVKP